MILKPLFMGEGSEGKCKFIILVGFCSLPLQKLGYTILTSFVTTGKAGLNIKRSSHKFLLFF